MSRSPGFPTAGGLPVTPDVQNTATSSKRRNRSPAKRRCSLPSATTASRNGVAIMRCPIAARSAEPRLAAAGRESEVQNRRCLENLGRVLRPLQRSARKAARPRRLRQATQPRPIEQVEHHGDPRKVTGSSQRSLLHAAGVPISAWISENMRATGNSYLYGHRRAVLDRARCAVKLAAEPVHRLASAFVAGCRNLIVETASFDVSGDGAALRATPEKSGSQLTPRWREQDSNPRSLSRKREGYVEREARKSLLTGPRESIPLQGSPHTPHRNFRRMPSLGGADIRDSPDLLHHLY
jgi:hypothetical protein